MLLTIWIDGLLTFDLKQYVVLGASLLAPLLMLAQAARRTYRLEGDRFFVSGPFGIGGSSYDTSNASIGLTHTVVAHQPAYRLAWTFPDGTERVMVTWVANRHPLLEALRRAMLKDAPPTALDDLVERAAKENASQRTELLRFGAIACVSIATGAAWLLSGGRLFG